MKVIPFSYSLRNLWARRLTTALTAGGMALVVFVFAAVLMLDQGLKETLVETGQPDNVVVIRKGSETEVQSVIERGQAALIESLPQIARGGGGVPLVSKETVVLITLAKRDSEKPANVIIRGVGQAGVMLRPQLQIVEGRMFAPGSNEIIVGSSIAARFRGMGLGDPVRFGGRDWRVVGVFDAGKSGFDSEIWGDADQLLQTFRRNAFSSVVFRLVDASAFADARRTLEDDPRLTLEAKLERTFYADQSAMLANFINILGLTLSVIFSIGAVIGAAITMYAAVASRTGEIGTLRALGFRKSSVLLAFMAESLLLSLLGGLAGLAAASLMQVFTISTMNWQSFSELAFSFRLTLPIAVKTLLFALGMGLVGGFMPAARAARMNIVSALRES
ncbi:ABC transporter permease [Zoogloea sp. 1C4]|uniref:ABC transporter permease n=1 Tax=Zoogloea sp. 1C4 TaxID=2570190 RepID=UPI0012929EDA|nr:ABC transporter permease [Zoogloea sp. 1C4]